MISRYEVTLNGVALSSISADILILDVKYANSSYKRNTYSVAKRNGVRVRRSYMEKSSVTVEFAIRAYDIRERQTVRDAVIKWAKDGGILQTNDREWQRLRCVCDSFPAITSVQKWTETLKIVFSAYVLPFWEECFPTTLELNGTSESGTLWVPGNADGALIEAEIKANAALTDVTLTANGVSLVLSELDVASGQKIIISYDDDLIQSIKVGNTSLLDKRSGADDLTANSGEMNDLSFSANADATVTFKVRGLWL